MYICTFQYEQTNPERKQSCAQCTHAYPHERTDLCKGVHCPNSNSHSKDNEHMFCKPIVDKKAWLKQMLTMESD